MATSKRFRASSGGTGRPWVAAALVGSFLLFAGPAAADTSGCPKAADSIFQAHEAWQKLPPEAAREIKILAIGSSSTAGLGASDPQKAYPAQLQEKLAGELGGVPVTVENAGISGETADATELRLEKAIEKGGYDLIVWQVGTNDALRGVDPDAFKSLVLRGVAAAKRAGTRMMLIDPQFYPGIKDVPRYEGFVKMVDTIGASNGVAVFSRYQMMKAWTPDLLASMLYTDQFHMSDRGYACVAQALADDIAVLVPATVITERKAAPGSKVTAAALTTLKPAAVAAP